MQTELKPNKINNLAVTLGFCICFYFVFVFEIEIESIVCCYVKLNSKALALYSNKQPLHSCNQASKLFLQAFFHLTSNQENTTCMSVFRQQLVYERKYFFFL